MSRVIYKRTERRVVKKMKDGKEVTKEYILHHVTFSNGDSRIIFQKDDKVYSYDPSKRDDLEEILKDF